MHQQRERCLLQGGIGLDRRGGLGHRGSWRCRPGAVRVFFLPIGGPTALLSGSGRLPGIGLTVEPGIIREAGVAACDGSDRWQTANWLVGLDGPN
ncbi:hypothetical protein L083_7669 [Actinoplanes sp. N902-109]|nr:hypothetical protein L083_7669 [Actinoplanes sp. N902-109]